MTDETANVYGLDASPLPDGYIPLEAVVIIKTLNDAGESSLVIRHAGEITDWERMGMLTAALDVVKEQTVASWAGQDDDDDEPDAA